MRFTALLSVALCLLSAHAYAAVRITNGTFMGCSFGNRGAGCMYVTSGGEERFFDLPSYRYTEEPSCIDPKAKLYGPDCELKPLEWELEESFIWKIDGNKIELKDQDGGWAGPDLPEFDPGQGWELGGKYIGCAIRIVERAQRKTIEIDSNRCR